MSNSIAEQLRWARTQLANESAQLDAEVLLAHVLDKNRSYLYAWPEKELATDELEKFRLLVAERQQGRPVAYLLGTQEFWSLSFHVTPATLIPRPETEQLVDAVLQDHAGKNSLVVVDAGTGSGAIAIALAHEKPQWQVCACDYSMAALQVAQANAHCHHAAVAFFCSDWLAAVQAGGIDVIVSNPPYIAPGDVHLPALAYEPTSALVAADHGLADIRQICLQASALLKSHGMLYVEHGYDQAQAVQQIFADCGFSAVFTAKDYAGCDRFTRGVKNRHE